MIALAPTSDAISISVGLPLSLQAGMGLQPTTAPISISTLIPTTITLVPTAFAITMSVSMPRLTVGGPFASSGRRILSLFRDNRLAPVSAE
jgi:hypothetical protein